MKFKIFTVSAILLFLLSSLTAYTQEKKDEIFRQGISYFSSGNYSQALEQWNDLYNTGYRSAELEYNIGNAYFKLNNIPAAVLFYERAHLLKPGDEDINYNLQITRTLIVDRFDEIPELFFVKWYNLMSLIMSSNKWAGISITAFFLCLFFLSIYFYTPKYRLKVTGFWLAIFLFILSLSSFAFSERNRTLIHNSHKAIIFSPQVSGKSSPDNSGTDLFVLHEGTKVTTGEKVGDWLEIKLSDGDKAGSC